MNENTGDKKAVDDFLIIISKLINRFPALDARIKVFLKQRH